MNNSSSVKSKELYTLQPKVVLVGPFLYDVKLPKFSAIWARDIFSNANFQETIQVRPLFELGFKYGITFYVETFYVFRGGVNCQEPCSSFRGGSSKNHDRLLEEVGVKIRENVASWFMYGP